MLKRVFLFSPDLAGRRHAAGKRSMGLAAVCAVSFLLATANAIAQLPAPSNAPNPSPVLSSPNWVELTPQQQQSLKPLADSWDAMADGHKRKWLALSQTFPRLPEPEQAKMHARMAEWAALKPKQREQARLNFAETKKIAPADRAANWEAYQALTDEEKKELALKARKKPASTAIAVKPVSPEKLAAVSVTRRTPEPAKEKQQLKQAIDRHTLLPVTRPPDANTIESPLSQGPHRQ